MITLTYHPAYLLRNPERKREVWEDMKKISQWMADHVGIPARPAGPEPNMVQGRRGLVPRGGVSSCRREQAIVQFKSLLI